VARLKNIVHSQDACTLIFKGDKSNAEPSMGAIKFPGGYVEVSRCSDGSYYAHIVADNSKEIIDSRIDYNHEASLEHGIPNIPDMDKVKKLSIKIKGAYREDG